MNENKKNILICGLGAIGGYYASLFYQHKYNIKILLDEARKIRYVKTPRIINGVEYKFDYITPDIESFKADVIIIATKSDGLKSAIKNIKNFVHNKTIILSFLNGITSEKELIKEYGDKVLYSYLLGHTFFRDGNKISHDGHAKIIYGSTTQNDERIKFIKHIFEDIRADYEIKDDIIKALWQKFCFNCCLNQLSALTRMTFGELKSSAKAIEIIKHISSEIEDIAIKEGILNPDFYNSVLHSLNLMIPEGKTSMLQDIEAKRKPEVDLFGETVVNLGIKYNIETPYNKIITELIKSLNI